MWDDIRLLDRASNGLYVLAGLLVAGFALQALVLSPGFPLRSIRIQGDLAHVQRSHIVAALEGRVSGTFFTVELEALRAYFEAIPWVRRAAVRRVWPDRLEVHIEEHAALARWGREEDRTLVNRQGELFVADTRLALPLLGGPAGSEREVAQRYADLSRLLAPISAAPAQVLLSERYAWQVRLDNGLTLRLGRDQGKDRIEDRLARFVSAYPGSIAGANHRPDYVDLRYPNGFALRLPQGPGAAAGASAGVSAGAGTARSASPEVRHRPGAARPQV